MHVNILETLGKWAFEKKNIINKNYVERFDGCMDKRMDGWKDDWVDEILANRKAGLERESEREGKKIQILHIIKDLSSAQLKNLSSCRISLWPTDKQGVHFQDLVQRMTLLDIHQSYFKIFFFLNFK